MIRFIAYWTLGEVFIPAAIMIITQLQGGVFEWPEVALVLWPSSIFLMATYGRELTVFGVLVLAMSLVINAALYSAVGALVWLLFGRFFR